MLADGLVRSNPFDGVTVTAVVNESRNVYVLREIVTKVMAAAPDADWRLIIALSRFGGLRSPSEVLSLKWENVRWWSKRILVVSPKTAHHPNGQQREIPLFCELAEPLRDAWNSRPQNANFVISRHRSKADVTDDWAACNLREPFLDILKRAGVAPWPKLFHAMRASCENDLVDAGYPLAAVTAWMGHSTKVAEKHYLRVISVSRRSISTVRPKSGRPNIRVGRNLRTCMQCKIRCKKRCSTRPNGDAPQRTENRKRRKMQALATWCVCVQKIN